MQLATAVLRIACMIMDEPTTIDALLDGNLHLRQPAKGHRAGTDALLLAAFARSLPGNDVADFGAGVGSAGLALAFFEPQKRVALVEIDPAQAALAADNIMRNQLQARVRAVVADITVLAAMNAVNLGANTVDLVMMNPPFLDGGRVRLSPLAQRRGAHVMPSGTLALWMKAARRCLKPGGHVALVHRADALADILAVLQTGFGAVLIRPIHARAREPAHRLLVAARLASKTPTVILPGLVLHTCHDSGGASFTPEAEAVNRNLRAISAY